ncbi:MAG: hypothetical protein NXI30_04730 [bacterium]|nr:hypothetical protein [bacterium]
MRYYLDVHFPVDRPDDLTPKGLLQVADGRLRAARLFVAESGGERYVAQASALMEDVAALVSAAIARIDGVPAEAVSLSSVPEVAEAAEMLSHAAFLCAERSEPMPAGFVDDIAGGLHRSLERLSKQESGRPVVAAEVAANG